MRDLFSQLGGLQDKLTGDPQLSDLLSRFAERVQEDLGGPEQLERMLRGFGLLGPEGPFGSGKAPGPTSYDDRPRPGNDAAGPHQEPPGAPGSGGRPTTPAAVPPRVIGRPPEPGGAAPARSPDPVAGGSPERSTGPRAAGALPMS